VLLGALAPFLVVAGFALATGLGRPMLDAVLREAAWQERLLPAVHFAAAARDYLASTAVSTAVIGLLATYFLVERAERLWIVLTFGWLTATFLTKVQVAASFVYPCLAVGLCAAFGLLDLVARITQARPGLRAAVWAVLVLLLSAIVVDQLLHVRSSVGPHPM
jgi:hypothetical protein